MPPDDDEILRRLDEMDAKLDQIKGDVSAVAYISKRQSHGQLREHFWDLLKGSDANQRIWLCLDEYRTPQEITQQAGIPEASVGKTLSRLLDKSVIHRERRGKYVKYRRSDMTEGLGLEKLIQGALTKKAKGKPVGTPAGDVEE